jgi:hypothetical protein
MITIELRAKHESPQSWISLQRNLVTVICSWYRRSFYSELINQNADMERERVRWIKWRYNAGCEIWQPTSLLSLYGIVVTNVCEVWQPTSLLSLYGFVVTNVQRLHMHFWRNTPKVVVVFCSARWLIWWNWCELNGRKVSVRMPGTLESHAAGESGTLHLLSSHPRGGHYIVKLRTTCEQKKTTFSKLHHQNGSEFYQLFFMSRYTWYLLHGKNS